MKNQITVLSINLMSSYLFQYFISNVFEKEDVMISTSKKIYIKSIMGITMH